MAYIILLLIAFIVYLLTTITSYKNKINSLENSIEHYWNIEKEAKKQSLFQNIKYTKHKYYINADGGCVKEILVEKDLLNNNDEETHIWKYKLDETGNILEEIHCNNKDEIYSIKKYSYNRNGNILKWIDSDEDLGNELRGVYTYDNNNNLIQLDRYNSDKILINRTTYSYNNLNLCVNEEVEHYFVLHKSSNEMVNKLDGYLESDLYIPKPDKIVYHYDNNGNMVERIFYEAFASFEATPNTIEKYVYSNNKLIEKLTYNATGLNERSILGYNNNNKEVIEVIENRYLGSSMEVICSSYHNV